MSVNLTEFESFEHQFIEVIGEFQTITSSDSRLREALRSESSRAENAEAGRAAAERAAAEARAGAAAAAAGAAQAAAALSKAHEEIAAVKLQMELNDRQRVLMEERCSDLSLQVSSLERELSQLRPLQSSFSNLQRQYSELQERIKTTTEMAKSEATKLESEVRRVERSACGGAEVRERARLAAAAHARERRLAAADLHHTSRELLLANGEIARLNTVIAELQHRISSANASDVKDLKMSACVIDAEALSEVRSALEAERAGAARLERALAAALRDNADLAAHIQRDQNHTPQQEEMPDNKQEQGPNISALDAFLAE